MPSNPLDRIEALSSSLAASVRSHMERTGVSPETPALGVLLEDLAWAFSQESAFGHAVCQGIGKLAGSVSEESLTEYHQRIRHAGAVGPTLGWSMATFLAPVLGTGRPDLLDRFHGTFRIMAGKGTYTLTRPLRVLESLIDQRENDAAGAYLDLLSETFSGDLLYNRCQHLSRILPEAVSEMDPVRRLDQIQQLHRVVAFDVRLVEAFVSGLRRGLASLTRQQLEDFVEEALRRGAVRFETAEAYLAVQTRGARSRLARWQVSVPLSCVRFPMTRYLQARIGRTVAIRPLSDLTRNRARSAGFPRTICSDGRAVYLVEEIEVFPSKERNRELYKCLAKLEALYHEFGTFLFDIEKFQDRYPGLSRPQARFPEGDRCDFDIFWEGFADPALAERLFCVFEHGRLRRKMEAVYPGLARTAKGLLQEEWKRRPPEKTMDRVLHALYGWIALAVPEERRCGLTPLWYRKALPLLDLWRSAERPAGAVEDTAALTVRAFEMLWQGSAQRTAPEDSDLWRPPFDRRIHPALFHETHRTALSRAIRMAERLSAREQKIYRSDIAAVLIRADGDIREKNLERIAARPGSTGAEAVEQILSLAADRNRRPPAAATAVQSPGEASALWYPEWDFRMADHLQEHVRLVSRKPQETENDFYERTLEGSAGLVRQVRRAFEMLRPEGLLRLRPWVEGDEFDDRSLLDSLVDRRAGRLPSDRLYTKKVKQGRDVAATLLIDLSRSTAHRLPGGTDTVLDVEKEAVVLFCEAMEVLGDRFSVAGFSGTGRLAVDYCEIKQWDEALDASVRNRIGALRPQRNTRMGAAVRHAAARFTACNAPMRLLIMLSDGFPNDTGYKQRYAVEDTRAAILEARARGIHTHAITVQLRTASRLDAVYGPLHHTLIADVRELPIRLLRLYGKLTR